MLALPQGFRLTWAGECSAWECDDLGHLNMRHYVIKAEQARRHLIIQLGLSGAFKIGAASSVRVRDLHIKYQGEARPGDPLRIDSAIISLDEDTAQLCHYMTHRSGKIAATIVETIEHIYLREQRAFPWPSRVHRAAPDFTAELPAPAKARTLDLSRVHVGPSRETLTGHGLAPVGAGVFEAAEVDNTGYVAMGAMFGRGTSTVGWASNGWPEFEDETYAARGLSAALLEARAVYHRRPQQGDAYDYTPALISADAYTRTILHNFTNPVNGESWMTMEAAGCKFDLNARKLIKADADDLALLGQRMTEGLSP